MSTNLKPHPLPSSYAKWFRATFIGVGSVELFFALLTMLQGPSKMMSQFGIPEAVISSPYYQDAMFWVILHMSFIGVTNIALGVTVRDAMAQRWLPRIFVLFHCVYTYLDIRASDSPLGTGLYQGAASLVTPVIGCTLLVAMLHLALRSSAKDHVNDA